MKPFHPGKSFIWLVLAATLLATSPSALARLGPPFQMPLGNPDGASTDTNSRTKFLINQRAEYVISYNGNTHQANWVGWSYSLADDGTQARTDAWAVEELLPSGYLRIGTATFGTGWDRGHMTPSADRTLNRSNNEVTFRMSNIIPQASQNNQGLWANFEDYCRGLAADGDEVVIISGPAQFTGARLNNQMSIPGSVWKIAVEIPNASSSVPANERITTSARVIALLTPNTSTGLGPWQSYITSVEQIEDVTGFNFFTAITNQSTAIYLKNLVDTGTGPNNPTVVTTFNPTLGTAGTVVTISGFNFGTTPVVQFNGMTATVQSSTANTISVQVPAGATSGYITVQGVGGTDTSYEPFTVSATVVPTLSLSPAALPGLTANQGAAGTAVPYALTGSNLTNSVTVTAPANFEVSKDGGSTFANTLTLSNDITGSLGAQLLARIKAGAPAGTVSGTITHTSGGATAANLAVSGSVISAAPNLSLSTNEISGLTALQNSAGTTAASYSVSGANLTGNITVSGSDSLEVSTNNISFGPSVSLSPSSGAINAATIHVRLAASATPGAVSGTITHSGGGLASPQSVSVSGSVTSTAPSLALSTNTVSGLSAVQNNPGGSKTYTLSGSFLTGSVSVAAPTGFEIGTNTTTFGASLTLAPSSGTLPSTTVYARLASSATTGAKSGTITHTGGGASQQNLAVTGTVNAPGSGETSTATWDFTTALPTSGVPAGVSVGAVSQGNNNGTTTMITTTSASSGYTGASGGNNAGAAARIGALNTNASGSAYFEFTITPTNGATFSVTDLSFGSRSTGTGPTAYVLRSSADNFTANIASGSFTANSAWALLSNASLSFSGSSATTFRLYGFSGTGTPTSGTANWRIDDLKVTISTGTSGPVNPKPVITSATTASGTAYSAFSYQITADNTPTYFSASGLPAGLSINSTNGLISGTPTVAGTFSIILTASNDSGDGTKPLTLTVAPQPAPAITSAMTAIAAVNALFQYQITAANSPTSFDATGLPAGLSVDTTTGLISGTPTATGTNAVNLSASNASGAGTAILTLTVEPDPNAPVISGPFAATGAVGTPFSYQITASNTPNTYLATGLPAGLTIDPLTGQISGTPTTKGASTVMIMASNGSGSDTKTLTINILEPIITVSQTDLSFTALFGLASEAQSYTLTGSDIASPLTVLAPGNFEISDDNGASFFDELPISPAPNGTVNASIKVRMKASAPLGESSGGIIHSGADAAPKYVNLTGFSEVAAATMDLSVSSLTGFTAKTGTPSFVQSYALTGAGLNGPVTITAPPGFQVSADNTVFSNSVTVAPDAIGTIAAKEIFVRMLSATAGSPSGPISHIGGGAEDRYLFLSGTVTAPSGPPIISPLSGSAYTNSTFSTRILAGGSLVATNFAATSLPGTLRINTTNGIISGTVPSVAGTNIFAVSASTQDGTTTTNYNLRVVSATQQNSIPTSVVINKFQNGLPDRVELLVIGDTNDAASGPPVDMRGMVLKDFSANRSTDDGGEFRFANHDLWSRVRAGTLIVLSAGNQSTEDTDPSDFVLRVNLGNATLMRQESPNFDIDDLDMVMIKPAAMGVEGFAGGIHALAAGRISGTTIYGLYTGRKIRSDRSLNSSRDTVYAAASSLSGYSSTSEDAAIAGSGIEFGLGNTSGNRSYITSLRGLDQTPPTVTLNGDALVNLAFGGTYTELGAAVTGGISATATVSGSVDTRVAGTYVITYSAVDNAGNAGTATRTVIVGKGAPLISELPTASAIVAGQRLSASTLTGGSASLAGNIIQGSFAWLEPDLVPAAGANQYAVVFIPADGSNYSTVSGTVAVTANQASGFAAWIASRQIAGTDAEPAADPDGDGAANLAEFAWGSDPSSQSEFPKAPDITRAEGSLRLTAVLRNDDPNLEIIAATTSDLRSPWNTSGIAEITVADQSNVPTGFRRRTWEVQNANPAAQFIRLNMRYP